MDTCMYIYAHMCIHFEYIHVLCIHVFCISRMTDTGRQTGSRTRTRSHTRAGPHRHLLLFVRIRVPLPSSQREHAPARAFRRVRTRHACQLRAVAHAGRYLSVCGPGLGGLVRSVVCTRWHTTCTARPEGEAWTSPGCRRQRRHRRRQQAHAGARPHRRLPPPRTSAGTARPRRAPSPALAAARAFKVPPRTQAGDLQISARSAEDVLVYFWENKKKKKYVGGCRVIEEER